MLYDIVDLTKRYQSCLDEMAKHFENFFDKIDYGSVLPKQVRIRAILSHDDLSTLLGGPGFYCIASTVPTVGNRCTLKFGPKQAAVVYRGHSHTVRERIESHLF